MLARSCRFVLASLLPAIHCWQIFRREERPSSLRQYSIQSLKPIFVFNNVEPVRRRSWTVNRLQRQPLWFFAASA